MTPLASGVPAGFRLEAFDRLPSTSDFCRERAAGGEAEGLAVLARQQDRGRGSRGRGWVSAPGNLFLSTLLRPGGPIQECGIWSLLAGVALHATVAELVPAHRLRLKWPNDLLLDGAKLAGILIDGSGDVQGSLDVLVIGFGVNLAAAPEVDGRRVTALAAAVDPPAPEEFAPRLLERLAHWRGVLRAEGPAAVNAAWTARSAPLGAPVTLVLPDRVVTGDFAGLSPSGALRLRVGTETVAFIVGETQLEPAGTEG